MIDVHLWFFFLLFCLFCYYIVRNHRYKDQDYDYFDVIYVKIGPMVQKLSIFIRSIDILDGRSSFRVRTYSRMIRLS